MNEETSNDGVREPEGTPGSAPVGGMAPEVSRRVSSILDAVEQEAARLREEAREETRLYLEDARRRADELVAQRRERLAALGDELIGKSEAILAGLEDAAPVRESFEKLVRALGDAADRLSEEAERTGPDFEPPPTRDEQAAVPASGVEAPGVPAADQSGGTLGPAPSQPDSLRTIAIQMASAGWTRGEVARHLQQTLGAVGVEPILEEVFGAGSADDARVPWTTYSR